MGGFAGHDPRAIFKAKSASGARIHCESRYQFYSMPWRSFDRPDHHRARWKNGDLPCHGACERHGAMDFLWRLAQVDQSLQGARFW